MNCNGFKRALHDYFLGHLAVGMRSEADRHAAGCAECGELMRVAGELSCRDFTEFLNDYVEERLDADRRAVFERHLAICPDCTAYLQSYRATMSLSAYAMKDAAQGLFDEVPPELIEAILAARSRNH